MSTNDWGTVIYANHDHWPDVWGGPGRDQQVPRAAWPLKGTCGQCGDYILSDTPGYWTLCSAAVYAGSQRHKLARAIN
jgi:hypothetical protein